MADTDLMMVVANNLLTNAIKYGTEGGEIRIDARVFDNKIEVEVYNDSEPISEEDKGKLFKKFSRLNNESTRKVKGTGLGLYITSQIIESHGGNIRVEPREKGNSFIFIIERGM
jgi:signal transduction histidine kinase